MRSLFYQTSRQPSLARAHCGNGFWGFDVGLLAGWAGMVIRENGLSSRPISGICVDPHHRRRRPPAAPPVGASPPPSCLVCALPELLHPLSLPLPLFRNPVTPPSSGSCCAATCPSACCPSTRRPKPRPRNARRDGSLRRRDSTRARAHVESAESPRCCLKLQGSFGCGAVQARKNPL